MMAGDAAATSLEQAYLANLGKAATYTATADALTMYDSGAMILVYSAAAANPLEGQWDVTGFNNGKQAVTSPIVGTALTAVFTADFVSGDAGCNTYSGPYTINGSPQDRPAGLDHEGLRGPGDVGQGGAVPGRPPEFHDLLPDRRRDDPAGRRRRNPGDPRSEVGSSPERARTRGLPHEREPPSREPRCRPRSRRTSGWPAASGTSGELSPRLDRHPHVPPFPAIGVRPVERCVDRPAGRERSEPGTSATQTPRPVSRASTSIVVRQPSTE